MKTLVMKGIQVFGAETSGATLAENCCIKNKKPLTEQGLSVFGAGNQRCDAR
jgi:hypothetical protein